MAVSSHIGVDDWDLEKGSPGLPVDPEATLNGNALCGNFGLFFMYGKMMCGTYKVKR